VGLFGAGGASRVGGWVTGGGERELQIYLGWAEQQQVCPSSQEQPAWSLQVGVEGLLGWGSAVGLVGRGGMSCCGLVRSSLSCPPGAELLLGRAAVVGWLGEPVAWSWGCPMALGAR